MPAGRRPLPAASRSMLLGLAQRNTPELPPYCLCFHSTTNSRLVTCFLVRMTPTGLPVHLIRLPSNDHVLSAQLTFTKSSSVMARQPASVPVIMALGVDLAGLAGLSSAMGCAWPRASTARMETVIVWEVFIFKWIRHGNGSASASRRQRFLFAAAVPFG